MSDSGVIGGRFELVREVGEGSQGKTYLARDADGNSVAVKELRFQTAASWKAVELFEREIETLRSLEHPAIPRFVDAVQNEDGFFMMQEFIEGTALGDLLAEGPISTPDLRRCAHDMLEVLHYLHELVPPVVHRDIKPANIIRRPTGAHVLVDFGGVQTITPEDVGGSTVIGTTGYMPSEQLIGRSSVQSDLYSLGATLVHLATGKHPAELPTTRLKIEWRDQASLPPRLATMIDQMLEPAPEDRPASARAAREMLVEGATKSGDGSTALVRTSDRDGAMVAITRPDGECAKRVRQRFAMSGQTLHVMLGPTLGRGNLVWMAAGLAAAALGAGIAGSAWPFVLALLTCGVFVASVRGGSTQSDRLVVEPNGEFEWHYGGQREPRMRRGTVTRGLRRTKSILLLPDEGDDIDLAGWLDTSERPWVAWILDRYLADGVVPAEIEVDP